MDTQQAPHAGAPHTSDARTARTLRALLGERGTIGEGRRAVGYALHLGCAHADGAACYHIAPVRAVRGDRMDFGAYNARSMSSRAGTGHDARVSWPMRAYDAEGTSPVRVGRLLSDGRTVVALGAPMRYVSREMEASLRRVRYAGGAAWRMRAMQRASA